MNWFSDTILSPRFWLGRQNTHPTIQENLTVAIVIPAWNEEDHIAETIRTCKAQTYPCTIIVANDCSTDATSEIAQSEGAMVYDIPNNQGSKARAVNYVLPRLPHDIIVIVDADTTLDTDAIQQLLNCYSDPQVMIACGMITGRHKRNIWELSRYAEYLVTQYIIKRAQGNARMIMVASGCFSSFRREWLESQNWFPERTMAEDMDLTWNAIRQKYRVALAMDAHCTVTDPPTWKTYRQQLMRWYRGFFQCIKARNYKLGFSRLAVTVYAYFVSAIIGAIMLLWFLITGFPLSIVGYFSILMLVPFIVVAYKSRQNNISWKTIILSFGSMICVLPINLLIFLYAAYLEFLKGDTLSEWHKGH